jgi:phospholipase/carboxylesterase/glyoxalase family protein
VKMTPGRELGFVHRFIPAQQPGTTLLLLHGTGGDEDDLLRVGQRLAPGAALLSPRGKVLENGMPRFFRRLAEGLFDLKDLTFRTHELADFLAAASSRYGFPPDRVFAAGYSNGANIAASLLLLRPEALAGAVLFRPMVPLTPESMPDLSAKRAFISAGRHDPIVPPEQPERLAALLRGAGAEVALRWSAAGHALTGEDIEAAREWLPPAI